MDDISKKIQEIIDELNAVGRTLENSSNVCQEIIERIKGKADEPKVS